MRKYINSRHSKLKENTCAIADAELDQVTGAARGELARALQDCLIRGGVTAAGTDNYVSSDGDSYWVYPDHMYNPD